MIQLKYSTDWNQKLQCPVHSTFRLKNEIFKKGMHVNEILVKGKQEIFLGIAEIIEIYDMKFDDIPLCVALADTGLDIRKFKGLIRTIYKNFDYDNQIFYWIWLKRK